MCGRYYVNNETAREIEKVLQYVDEKLKQQSMINVKKIAAKDIHPTEQAPVLAGKSGSVYCGWQRWGFPGFQGKQVIFNARSESAMQKALFRDSICHSRIVLPAAWFYEWNLKKEKNTFYRQDASALFMAGCCRQYEDGAHFVILTTRANASMEPVHDRMPLILEQNEIVPWILNDQRAAGILHKTPCLLKRKSEYEQLSLF
ncbi:MAG: SOS response-associated peptidase [Lachnospiraceae bacterium]|jgi:putative SOS response-associated peptidase YedK|nr:SOS response-associated peptidase [Lachnospiraceae bacterium]